jgi:hypothetical protein
MRAVFLVASLVILAVVLSDTAVTNAMPRQQVLSHTISASSVDDTVLSTNRFTFQSNFWINLHHFLYQWANTRNEPDEQIAEEVEIELLAPDERDAWERGIGYYQRVVIERGILDTLQGPLIAQLIELGIDQVEAVGALPDSTARTLAELMPIYRSRWWEKHDRTNREWIQQLQPLLERHEETLVQQVTHIWKSHWPEQPYRVDIAVYASRVGAYTPDKPDHSMVSSTFYANQGFNALESVLHEAHHMTSLEQARLSAVYEAFNRRQTTAPRRLYHALLFYTAGELIRSVAAKEGTVQYQTQAEIFGFYKRDRWSGFRKAFDTHWKAVLLGEIDPTAALDRIAADISVNGQ